MSDFKAPFVVEETQGLPRVDACVRVGVPLPKGRFHDACSLEDANGYVVPSQAKVLTRWQDGSAKWVLLDALLSMRAHERRPLFLVDRGAVRFARAIRVAESADHFEIDTGIATFAFDKRDAGPLQSVKAGEQLLLGGVSSAVRLVDKQNNAAMAIVEHCILEESGPLRVSVLKRGRFMHPKWTASVTFETRAVLHAGSGCVAFDFQITNPNAARHPGGLWDLGDAGSAYLKDLSIALSPRASSSLLHWHEQGGGEQKAIESPEWLLYQDSSGGQNWDSDNHVNHERKPTVSFCGYEVRVPGKVLSKGARATPILRVGNDDAWIAVGLKDFWQNFPKALRWREGELSIGLFPAESSAGFELQGGERKRHTLFLEFGGVGTSSRMTEWLHPLLGRVDSSWIEMSGAVPYFAAAENDATAQLAYVHSIVEGQHSFEIKRELIDEYGWRNFGDLYADHEAVRHTGPRPLVSHYNNQYDFIYGAAVHWLRSGDARWRALMEAAARHMLDIDIYHTDRDRAAFNGGLFWHTDHYKPAATCTHRTYSGRNRTSGAYGGGPSNEHNYTSGLLHYYFLTGDEEAKQAVCGLADWVMAMDDGRLSLFSLVDESPTGNASKTVSADYHKPGRGAGNSINALLDAYALSRDRRYFAKAEELIFRCIHPADDVAALKLDEPEFRWSYLVFLQILAKYLDTKSEMNEVDYAFFYARDSLRRYADWMLEHEVPYKDVLHKVELPTETWPAHDIRKAHVLFAAAKYGTPEREAAFREKADLFAKRCIDDVLSFKTAFLTRPLVILCVYGHVPLYFQKHADSSDHIGPHGYDFGTPAPFVRQQDRLRAALRSKVRIVAAEIRRAVRDKLSAVSGKFS